MDYCRRKRKRTKSRCRYYSSKSTENKINESNYEDALKTIHTLKGVSGNISAKSLEKITAQLESEIVKLKDGIKKDSLIESLELFHLEFTTTMNEISAFLEKNVPENLEDIHVSNKYNDNISLLVKNLELNLNKFIPKKCLEIIMQIRFICEESWTENLNELENYIKKYRAKEAKLLLAEILKKWNN